MLKKLFAGFLVSLLFLAAAEPEGLTLDNYFQLTKVRLQAAAIEWQARIAAAQQAKGDRKMLLTRSNAISKEYAGYHRQLHAKFDTNPIAFVRFGTEHAREIDSYLAGNPQVKQEIDSLRQTVEGLMQTFDSLAAPMLAGGQK
jgi:hypothetical protein